MLARPLIEPRSLADIFLRHQGHLATDDNYVTGTELRTELSFID